MIPTPSQFSTNRPIAFYPSRDPFRRASLPPAHPVPPGIRPRRLALLSAPRPAGTKTLRSPLYPSAAGRTLTSSCPSCQLAAADCKPADARAAQNPLQLKWQMDAQPFISHPALMSPGLAPGGLTVASEGPCLAGRLAAACARIARPDCFRPSAIHFSLGLPSHGIHSASIGSRAPLRLRRLVSGASLVSNAVRYLVAIPTSRASKTGAFGVSEGSAMQPCRMQPERRPPCNPATGNGSHTGGRASQSTLSCG